MLDILEQMYPQKEYIDIELLGVDLLDDLGIEPLDYKLRMHKDRRYNSWVSEVNGWSRSELIIPNARNLGGSMWQKSMKSEQMLTN